jgi:antitoxin VapB
MQLHSSAALNPFICCHGFSGQESTLTSPRHVVYIMIHIMIGIRWTMTKTAKLFTTGRSQAVRLPKEFRFEGSEVFIRKEGDNVILSEKPTSWEDFFSASERPTDDFMAERVDVEAEKRELFG